MAHLYNLAVYWTRGTVVRDQLCLNNVKRFMPLPISYEGHPYDPEVEHFSACIVEDRPPLIGVTDGANAVAIALAIEEAYRSGKAVRPRVFRAEGAA